MLEKLPNRIQDKIFIDPKFKCWLWTAALGQGYGWVHFKGAKRAHRVVYELLIGRIPKEKELHHICEERSCCNPEHLELVTRKKHKDRHPVAPPTHCKQGHPFSGTNLVDKYGQRQCRECLKAAMKRYNKKHRNTGRPPGRPKIYN